METNINSVLCRVRHLIHSNKIKEASIIAEPYTLATDYVLQNCNHELDPMYKDFTVFKHKYVDPTFTGKGLGSGNSSGDGHLGYGFGGYGFGFGNWYGNGTGDGTGDGHLGYGFGGYGGYGFGNWSGNGSGDGYSYRYGYGDVEG